MNRNPPLPAEIAALVAGAAGGDRRAAEALILLYRQRVARFAIALTGDAGQYEDLCQTVFVKMVLGLPRLADQSRFEPWLFRIARNVCRDHLRSRLGWRRLFVALSPEHDFPMDEEFPDDGARTLEERIARLPEAQRSILRLALEENRSYEDLARICGTSVPAVKSRLHRARENLRALMLADDPK